MTETERSGGSKAEAPELADAPKPRRLLSLDAFRGFDIAAMLFVNMTWNREVFHPQFFHVDWNDPAQGATFTDLVFPWFLFIAGAAIPLSMRSGRGRAQPWWKKLLIAAKRGLILYLLGVLLTVASKAYDTPLKWTDLLSWNILQLIGVGYFFAVAIYLLPLWWRVGLVAGILIAKWGAMAFVSWDWVNGLVTSRAVEGAPVGPHTWAHWDGIKRVLNCEHMEAGWVKWILGWLGMSQQFLPLAAVAVLGGLTTEILTKAWSERRRVLTVLGFGLGMTAVGHLLHVGYDPAGGGPLGPLTMPYSKWFFTPSYCLLSAGTGAMLLALFYLGVDVWGKTTLWFLRVYGLNAIVLYVGAELSFKTIFAKWQITHPNGYSGAMAGGFINWVTQWTGSAAAGGWAFVLAWLGGWWLVCWWLYKNKFFVKV